MLQIFPEPSKDKKVSLLLIFKNVKVIQSSLLYNKIKCYKQRIIMKSHLLSERLHSYPKILKIHEARPLDYVQEQQINFLSSWELWCFLRSKYRGAFCFHPTNWCEGHQKAIIVRLMGSSTIKKSSNEHEFFVTITALNKIGEGRIRDLTGDILFPVTSHAPCSLRSGRIWDITSASCPIISWGESKTTRIFLALRQTFWLPKCSPTKQAGCSKYPPMDATKTLEPAPSI